MKTFGFQEHLKKQVDGLPTMDDLNNLDIYVKWPQLEEALNARRSRTPSAKSRVSTPKPRTPTENHLDETHGINRYSVDKSLFGG